MKKFNLIAILAVALFLTNTLVNASGINEEYSNYKISPVENFDADNNIKKVWNLEYSSEAAPITVVKRSTKSATHYVVKSEYFEVCYAAAKKGFGVTIMKNSWRNIPEQLSNAVLNADAMKMQTVLTQKNVDDDKALGLIASYLPDLLNESYKHLLN